MPDGTEACASVTSAFLQVCNLGTAQHLNGGGACASPVQQRAAAGQHGEEELEKGTGGKGGATAPHPIPTPQLGPLPPTSELHLRGRCPGAGLLCILPPHPLFFVYCAQVLATVHRVESCRSDKPRNILQILSSNTRRTKVVELSAGTHRCAGECGWVGGRDLAGPTGGRGGWGWVWVLVGGQKRPLLRAFSTGMARASALLRLPPLVAGGHAAAAPASFRAGRAAPQGARR